MGMTKALQEKLILSDEITKDKTTFCCVRYGNVLGSRGSVIPLWDKRLEQNKPLPITHPDMTRFVLTLTQAIDLVFYSLKNSKGGEIFVKKEAAAVKQAVKNLILTDYFEKPFEPFYGGNIRALLFELADDDVEEETRENIIRAINAYEPRAIVREVSVSYQEERNSISIYIEFQVINTEEVVTFTTSLSRLR